MDVQFTRSALKDFEYWKQHDQKKVDRITELLQDIRKHPYSGIGKPEALKYDLSGWHSRRIDKIHRLVYRIDECGILVLSCRHHY